MYYYLSVFEYYSVVMHRVMYKVRKLDKKAWVFDYLIDSKSKTPVRFNLIIDSEIGPIFQHYFLALYMTKCITTE